MKEEIIKKLKKIQKSVINLSETLYEKGLVAKETIDFTVKSSIYIYVGSWVLIFMWLIETNRIKKEELLPNIKLILEQSEYLMPLSILAVILSVFIVLIPFFPNIIKSKTGRVFLFFCIVILFLFTFGKAVIILY